MATIERTWHEVSNFASKFSDAGLAANNMPVLLIGGANVIADLGKKYFQLSMPAAAVVESLKLSYALRLISSPIQAVKSAQQGIDSYKGSDHVGLLFHAIGSVREVIKTLQASFMIESLAFGVIHKSATSVVGQVLFKCSLYLTPLTTALFGIKMLVSTFEVISLQAQVWSCKDQKARADFLKGRLQPDIASITAKKVNFVALTRFEKCQHIKKLGELKHLPDTVRFNDSLTIEQKLAYLDKVQGAEATLKRVLGSKGLEHLKNDRLDELDSQLKWGAAIQTARVALLCFGVAFGPLFAAGLLPVPVLMFVDICLDLDALVSIAMYINDTVKDLRSEPRDYDRYLIVLSAAVLATIMITVAFVHLAPICLGVLAILSLLSAAFMAYTYRKVKLRHEHKFDSTRFFEFPGIGEGAVAEHDSSLQERSADVPRSSAA